MQLPFRTKREPAAGTRRVAPPARPATFSYHAYRAAQPEITSRKRFRDVVTIEAAHRASHYWFRRFGLLAVLLAGLAAAVNMLLLSTHASVVPADPAQAGSFLHDIPTYEQAADKLLAGSFWNRNKLTVDEDGIGAALQQQFPELASVTISLPLVSHDPVVHITPAPPVLRLASTDGHTYFVAANGRALGDVSLNAGSTLPMVQDQSDRTVHVGELALPSTTVAFIQTVLYQLQHKQLSVTSFVLPAGTSELDVRLDGVPYIGKFNLADNSPVQQVGTFLAVRHSLQGKGITPSKYIDVRVEGRAYYK